MNPSLTDYNQQYRQIVQPHYLQQPIITPVTIQKQSRINFREDNVDEMINKFEKMCKKENKLNFLKQQNAELQVKNSSLASESSRKRKA